MHPNPIYRPETQEAAWRLAQNRGFGVITISGSAGILASHIPFVTEDGPRIAAHLVRSNPIAAALKSGPLDALLIVSGPDAYISPDWYETDDQVPTWNYVAVHLRGTLRLLPDEALLPHLEALSDHNESQLAPKPVWTHDKMTPGVMDRMMRQIVPVALDISDIQSTWKLNQNKDDAARHAAADAVETSPTGHQQIDLANLMRRAND